MTPEAVVLREPTPQLVVLEPILLPSEESKNSRMYEIFAGDQEFGSLKVKPNWKTLEWAGGDIFHDPHAELLDKLRDAFGARKRDFVTAGIIYQDGRKTPQFTAALTRGRGSHKVKEYKAMMENPSRIIEVRYDTKNFQVIAHNPDHNGGRNTTRLKLQTDRRYTPEVLQWVIDHHADGESLPPIDSDSSVHILSRLR